MKVLTEKAKRKPRVISEREILYVEYVNRCRLVNKLSQENLAKLLGTSVFRINRIENYKSIYTLYEVVKLCEYFDLEIERFLKGEY